jgi:hypothetical protein
MKKLLIAAGFALAACFALFAGCASNGSAPALPTPQQLFSQACPIVNADLAILAQSPLLTSAQQDVLTKTIIPANQGICSAGVQISVANLKAFHDSLLPAAIAIVQAVPAIPNQPVILLALQTFGPLVQQMIDGVIVAVAPAASAPAASAPVAASATSASTQ